jgi:hypothetical protein
MNRYKYTDARLLTLQVIQLVAFRHIKLKNIPGVLYGCETWSLALREKRSEGVDNTALGRIYGSTWESATGAWRIIQKAT